MVTSDGRTKFFCTTSVAEAIFIVFFCILPCSCPGYCLAADDTTRRGFDEELTLSTQQKYQGNESSDEDCMPSFRSR